MVSCYVIAIIKIYTQANIITNMSDAIDCFTSSWITFHVLTPMSGALFLVNTTISSVNVRFVTYRSSKFGELNIELLIARLVSLRECLQAFEGTTSSFLPIF